MRTCIFLLLFCFYGNTVAYSAETDSAMVKNFLIKYKLEKTEPLLLFAVNPLESDKNKIGMKTFYENMKKQGLGRYIIFLTLNLRKNESQYYFNNRLNMDVPASKIIIDKDFYQLLNPEVNSRIIFISNQSIVKIVTPLNADKEIVFNVQYPKKTLSFKDSVKLDESVIPLSTQLNMEVVEDKKLVVVDKQYGNAMSYDIATGKMESKLDLNYDFKMLFRTAVSTDTAKLGFAQRFRTVLKERLGMKEFILYNLCRSRQYIYVGCSIMAGERSANGDTIAQQYNFIIRTTAKMESPAYFFLPEPSNGSFLIQNDPFFTTNDTDFIFTVGYNKSDDHRFLAHYKLDAKQKRFTQTSFSAFTLPEYFTKNKKTNSHGSIGRVLNSSEPLFYFNKLIPFVYNVKNDQVLQLPDTSYKHAGLAEWNASPILFAIYNATATKKKGEYAFLVNRLGIVTLELAGTDLSKFQTEYSFPARFTENTLLTLSTGMVYAIRYAGESVYLYKERY